ncbi:MAG: hypothetical protein IH964_10590 [Candidatus Dadabacteria bacterium]|nr:hypothetical protein [Candidatus Dadabacteria bacterium]
MSTILKALKRLEEDKKKNVERPLDEQILASDRPDSPKRRVSLIAFALIGGIVVGSSALYFWPGDIEPEPESAPSVVTSSIATPESDPSIEPSPASMEIPKVQEMMEMLEDAAQPEDATKSAEIQMMMKMMPHFLEMMLPKLSKEDRSNYVLEIASILFFGKFR